MRGQIVQPIGDRAQKPVEPGEREVRLGLLAGRAQHDGVSGGVLGVRQ